MWNEISTEEDIVNFMNLFGGFHDSCIKEIRYVSGAYVGANLGMKPFNDSRTVDIIFQRQWKNPMAIVMRFTGLNTLQLAPVSDKYTCDIFDASMFFKNNCISWADSIDVEKEDIESYCGTWICADSLQWRATDECIGEDEVFLGKFEVY